MHLIVAIALEVFDTMAAPTSKNGVEYMYFRMDMAPQLRKASGWECKVGAPLINGAT